MKKDSLLDVTIGTYDGPEVCKIVETFLLDKISEKSGIDLYHNDGLSVFKNKSGTQLKIIEKSLQKTFKNFGSEIVPESNLKIVNYLDVTLNLNDIFFKPYYELYDIIQYINKEFTYTPNHIKHLPAFTDKRLSNNFSHKKIFKESAIY